MRQYAVIWNTLVKHGTASVTVSKDHARTLIAGVVELKCDDNTLRKKTGLIPWSKLIIKRTSLSATHMKIDFSFVYRVDL